MNTKQKNRNKRINKRVMGKRVQKRGEGEMLLERE